MIDKIKLFPLLVSLCFLAMVSCVEVIDEVFCQSEIVSSELPLDTAWELISVVNAEDQFHAAKIAHNTFGVDPQFVYVCKFESENAKEDIWIEVSPNEKVKVLKK